MKTMIVGAGGLGILGPIMLWVISSGDSLWAFFAQWFIGILLSTFDGPTNAWLVEKFPAKHRLTSASLGYDMAHCTTSAFSPLVATVLVKDYGPLAPGLLYPFFAPLAIVGMFVSRKFHTNATTVTNDAKDKIVESESNTEPLL
ncbi:hypothetical protein ACHAWF_001104 [Thalassiosira exigua]